MPRLLSLIEIPDPGKDPAATWASFQAAWGDLAQTLTPKVLAEIPPGGTWPCPLSTQAQFLASEPDFYRESTGPKGCHVVLSPRSLEFSQGARSAAELLRDAPLLGDYLEGLAGLAAALGESRVLHFPEDSRAEHLVEVGLSRSLPWDPILASIQSDPRIQALSPETCRAQDPFQDWILVQDLGALSE